MFSRKLQILSVIALCALTSTTSMARTNPVDNAAKQMDARASDERVYFDVGNAADDQRKQQESNCSLWVNTYSARLYENMYRASRPGDTVTIVVSESSGFERS